MIKRIKIFVGEDVYQINDPEYANLEFISARMGGKNPQHPYVRVGVKSSSPSIPTLDPFLDKIYEKKQAITVLVFDGNDELMLPSIVKGSLISQSVNSEVGVYAFEIEGVKSFDTKKYKDL